MHAVWNLLNKIIVIPFYKRNGGWMLLLFIVVFALIQNPILFHSQMMELLTSSALGLLIAAIVWSAYALKCLYFQMVQLKNKENSILFELVALTRRQQYSLVLSLETILFLPVILYGNCTLIYGIVHDHYKISIVLFLVGLWLFIGLNWKIVQFINTQNVPGFWDRFQFKLVKKRPFYSFGISAVITEKPKHFFLVKIISLLILSIPLIRNSGTTELSDFLIFWSVAIGANIVVFHDLFMFYIKDLPWLKNMPIHLGKYFIVILSSIIVIILPELLLLAVYRQFLPNLSFVEIALYSIGISSILYMLQWQKGTDLSGFLTFAAVILILQLFLAPYHLFLWLGLALIVFSFIVFRSLYYNYEVQFTDEKDLD